jgi:hypothetical protein
VSLNATSCEVESPWEEEGEGTVELGEEVCDLLDDGIRIYVSNRLFPMWGIGVPVAPV